MSGTEGCDSETCPVFSECMDAKKFLFLSDEELYDLMNLLSSTNDYGVIKQVLGVDFAKKMEDKGIPFEQFLKFHAKCTGKKNI